MVLPLNANYTRVLCCAHTHTSFTHNNLCKGVLVPINVLGEGFGVGFRWVGTGEGLSGLVAGDSAICGRLAALILQLRPAGLRFEEFSDLRPRVEGH